MDGHPRHDPAYRPATEKSLGNDFGPGLFELNGDLRAALDVDSRAAERDLCESIPTEYDANRTAARYAREHHAGELTAMAADERFAPSARDDYGGYASDLLEATLRAVNENVDLDQKWNGKPIAVDIGEQYEQAREHAARDRGFDRYNPTRADRPAVVYLAAEGG
jgi:hypothetical protein